MIGSDGMPSESARSEATPTLSRRALGQHVAEAIFDFGCAEAAAYRGHGLQTRATSCRRRMPIPARRRGDRAPNAHHYPSASPPFFPLGAANFAATTANPGSNFFPGLPL